MKQIPFKTSDAYALKWHNDPVTGRRYIKPTKRFVKDYQKTIYPKRGLRKHEMAALPKGITVIGRKIDAPISSK